MLPLSTAFLPEHLASWYPDHISRCVYLCVGSRALLPVGEHICEGERFWPLKDEVGLWWASWVHLWDSEKKKIINNRHRLLLLSHSCQTCPSHLCSTAAPSAWRTASRCASSSRPKPSSPSARADPSARGRPPDGCRGRTRLEDRQERCGDVWDNKVELD